MSFRAESRADLALPGQFSSPAVPGERTTPLAPGKDHRLFCARRLTAVISFSPRKVHFTVEDREAWRMKTLVQG